MSRPKFLAGLAVLVVVGAAVGLARHHAARKLHPFTANELPPEARFTCLLPEGVERTNKSDSVTWRIGFDDRSYSITVVKLSEKRAAQVAEHEDQAYKAVTSGYHGQKMRDVKSHPAKDWFCGGHTGREVDMSGQRYEDGRRLWMRSRVVFVERHMFMILAVVDSEKALDHDADVKKFLDSFRLPKT